MTLIFESAGKAARTTSNSVFSAAGAASAAAGAAAAAIPALGATCETGSWTDPTPHGSTWKPLHPPSTRFLPVGRFLLNSPDSMSVTLRKEEQFHHRSKEH